ncbi:MAG TPA: ATP-grasp domain-containing protein [Planctomycetes bacterium]|nr:ATP-grasp domain-containing protein [Planctomycetota bacterium]
MDVLLLAPGFPAEMPLFTRGLAEIGARVFGVGDGPAAGLDAEARRALSGYLEVKSLLDEEDTLRRVLAWLGGRSVDRVECQWEPGVVLAARLREALGVPGMGVEQATCFRDKETMKQVLDAAGIRTPYHHRARTEAEVRDAAAEIGYPIIVKPIAGAGSADTYPVRSDAELDDAIARIGHVPEVSVEEYVEGEEFTFDTICAEGDVLYHNVAWYRPKPLLHRLNPWISGQAIALRDTSVPDIAKGCELGLRVLRALEFRTGFTHMEWFLTPSGEAIFGEIGARPPGARLVHAMNYGADIDLFRGWAEAVCRGRLSQDTHKRYNVALIFKRADGAGRVVRYEGLDALLGRFAEHVPVVDLTPIGSPRRDWTSSVVGDGWIVVRHPDLSTTIEIADRFASELRIVAS